MKKKYITKNKEIRREEMVIRDNLHNSTSLEKNKISSLSSIKKDSLEIKLGGNNYEIKKELR